MRTVAVISSVSALLLGVLAPACGGGSDDAANSDDASADGATADGGGPDGSKGAGSTDAGAKGDAAPAVKCAKASDCDAGVCNMATGFCSAASCSDGTKNESETDIDCGGTCKACDNTKKCAVAADCTSKVCKDLGKGLQCQAPTNMDGVQNGPLQP